MLWPIACPVCGRIGVSHCLACMEGVFDPLPVFCLECGGVYDAKCCYSSSPAYAVAPHEGVARTFLLNLKYRNVRDLGIPMGRLMAECRTDIKADAILPIPLHRDSAREYNQTDLLALGLSDVLDIKTLPEALNWNFDVGRQTSRHGRERKSLPADSFFASCDLNGVRVIIVDDVYTTGGTARAAKAAVERAGGTVEAAFFWSRRITLNESTISWNGIEE